MTPAATGTHPHAPRVSVVVRTFNRPGSLRRCLESLAAQTLPRDAFELILVDTSDQPVQNVVTEFAGRLHMIHHPRPNLGVAGNRNAGAARSRAPIIAFLDDDCVADPRWLEHMTTAVEAHPRCLVGGAVHHPDPANAYAAAGQTITEAVHDFFNPPGGEPRFVPGLNFAVERERYLAISGCDEGFGRLAAEDRDFIDRWRLSEGQLLFCPDAGVRHEHRGSLRGFLRQYFNYGRGAWRYHSLRRRRQSGRMATDIRLHFHLPRHFRQPLARLRPAMRPKVVALLGLWQLANAAGFVSQGVLDATAQRKFRRAVRS